MALQMLALQFNNWYGADRDNAWFERVGVWNIGTQMKSSNIESRLPLLTRRDSGEVTGSRPSQSCLRNEHFDSQRSFGEGQLPTTGFEEEVDACERPSLELVTWNWRY
mmetsp:Transcript_34692/g.92660  ORF Transcript_34692/g.92660 Transcript_34692/m.92660 type:complete len:108 (-) Transcript_34692:149-472(-)